MFRPANRRRFVYRVVLDGRAISRRWPSRGARPGGPTAAPGADAARAPVGAGAPCPTVILRVGRPVRVPSAVAAGQPDRPSAVLLHAPRSVGSASGGSTRPVPGLARGTDRRIRGTEWHAGSSRE